MCLPPRLFVGLVLINGQKHARILFVSDKTVFSGLVTVGKGYADKKKHEGVCKRAAHKPPTGGHYARCGKGYPPPHYYFSEVVRVAGIFPKPVADKAAAVIFAENVHLYVRSALQYDGGYRDAEKYNASRVKRRRRCRHISEYSGEYATVNDEGGHQMYAQEIHEYIPPARLLREHGVSPILI